MTSGRSGSRVLITGERGFIGRHLGDYLDGAGFHVSGLQGDILDAEAVAERVRTTRPETIIHLAAISHPLDCDRDPETAERVNVGGTRTLLDGIRSEGSRVAVVFASTGQVYRPHPHGSALDENSEIAPVNRYAETKWAGERALLAAAAMEEGLRVRILRIFNHIHHTQPEGTFVASLRARIDRVRGGDGAAEVEVGDLTLKRDIGPLQDLLSAVKAVIEAGDALPKHLTLNVCNGRPRELKGVAEELARQLGVDCRFRPSPAFLRKDDPKTIYGSNAALREATGWSPSVRSDAELIRAFFAPL